MQIIPVVFATNESYAPYVASCLESIKKNSSKDCFYKVYVLHTCLLEDTKNRLSLSANSNLKIECIDVSSHIEDIRGLLYSHSYFSEEMYFRILIPELFPNEKKVIYLDCDTVVLGDLAELYNFDISEYCIGAIKNPMHKKMYSYVKNTLSLDPRLYVNSGVLLINCQKFIEMDIKNKIFAEIKRHNTLNYPDQDLINLVCKDSIYYLPLNFNYLYHLKRLNNSENEELRLFEEDLLEFNLASQDIRILHYTGDKKPWQYNNIEKADVFWKYAGTCTFSDIIKERFCSLHPELLGIKLLFADFKGDDLVFTCAHCVLDGDNDSSVIVSINKEEKSPLFFFEKKAKENEQMVIWRLFSFNIPIAKILSEDVSVSFSIDDKVVMPNFGTFFPLNDCYSSYFSYNGILMHQKNISIILEADSRKKKKAHERAYLRALRKSKNPYQKSAFFKRLTYHLTKNLVPSNIWLISDRPEVGGDNGEALFSYLSNSREYKNKIRPYFVIDKKSPDYKRLKGIGRVLRLSSLKHKIYALHCDTKAVSQTDHELYNVINRTYIKDLLYKEKRVFLQHGITKDDISESYSKYYHNFDLFITAAYKEYESIINNKNYGLDSSTTKLTGFPRHDLLKNEAKKAILISPTWRRYLLKNDQKNEYEFKNSTYFKAWHSILSNEELSSYLNKKGYEIYFVPHNKIESYLDLFKDCKNVKILSGAKCYSEIFSSGALLISDYSSNTFEFSYLRKGVIYYQFDRDEFFSSHTYKKGYFDYLENGFGPVAFSEGELIDLIKSAVDNNCALEPLYRERIDKFFMYSDRESSKRVTEEILKIKK